MDLKLIKLRASKMNQGVRALATKDDDLGSNPHGGSRNLTPKIVF